MPPLADSPYRPASRRRAIGEALFAVVVWGATFVATKRALVDASPAFVVAIRSGLGALVLAGVAAWRGEMARVPLRLLGKLAFLGFLGIGFHQWLQAQALMTSDASTAAWLVTVSPIFTALLGRTMLGERLGRIGVAGIGVAAFGVIWVVARGDLGHLAASGFGTMGDFLMLFSALNWSIYTVLSRRVLRAQPAGRTTFYVLAFGCLFTALWWIAAPGGSLGASIARIGTGAWISIAFLGILGSALAPLAWNDALETIPAARLSVFLYLEPPITTALAVAIGQESWRWATLWGGLLIVLGVVMVNLRSRAQLAETTTDSP
ncbi:MAG TPA: DMT family transporter [Thermoanaerobaculia bacterium]|nr:DMT family transporter [Thermoanaerobaculia bacterium]